MNLLLSNYVFLLNVQGLVYWPTPNFSEALFIGINDTVHMDWIVKIGYFQEINVDDDLDDWE